MGIGPGFGYIEQKKMEDGTILKVASWISGVIMPGKRMYQLELVEKDKGFVFKTSFPRRFEDYSGAQILGMFESINSKEDFNKICNE